VAAAARRAAGTGRPGLALLLAEWGKANAAAPRLPTALVEAWRARVRDRSAWPVVLVVGRAGGALDPRTDPYDLLKPSLRRWISGDKDLPPAGMSWRSARGADPAGLRADVALSGRLQVLVERDTVELPVQVPVGGEGRRCPRRRQRRRLPMHTVVQSAQARAEVTVGRGGKRLAHEAFDAVFRKEDRVAADEKGPEPASDEAVLDDLARQVVAGLRRALGKARGRLCEERRRCNEARLRREGPEAFLDGVADARAADCPEDAALRRLVERTIVGVLDD